MLSAEGKGGVDRFIMSSLYAEVVSDRRDAGVGGFMLALL